MRLAVSLFVCASLAQAAPHMVEVPGGALEVTFEAGRFDVGEAAILDWIGAAASAVAGYFGRFPMARMPVKVRPVDGAGVPFGHADDDRVTLMIGKHVTKKQLADDWVITHELTHLALPSLPRPHHWMEEGLATYVEPIARAQKGVLTPEKVWGDLVDGLPQGQPLPGDRGLDYTPSWGRTYWGGALFFVLCDVEIRARTNNQKGLQQALRGVVAAGGNMQKEWPIERVLQVADQTVGVPVMKELYDQMKASPHPVDLAALWRRLGVVKEGARVRFDDSAPLAAVRRAITTAP
jgi:hypothetical protein